MGVQGTTNRAFVPENAIKMKPLVARERPWQNKTCSLIT
jgi:hypothetical protein